MVHLLYLSSRPATVGDHETAGPVRDPEFAATRQWQHATARNRYPLVASSVSPKVHPVHQSEQQRRQQRSPRDEQDDQAEVKLTTESSLVADRRAEQADVKPGRETGPCGCIIAEEEAAGIFTMVESPGNALADGSL